MLSTLFGLVLISAGVGLGLLLLINLFTFDDHYYDDILREELGEEQEDEE